MTTQHVLEERGLRSHADHHRMQPPARAAAGEMSFGLSTTAIAHWRAAIVALAPAVLLAGFLYHPHIADLPNPAAVAAAVTADPTRWAVAHLLVAAGSGLMILAFLALRGLLREEGEGRWSALAVPFVVVGSTIFAMLPAMEFAPLAAALSGGDAEAMQVALDRYFVPLLITGAAVFAVGVIGFAIAIARHAMMPRGLAWFVAGALVVMAAARFVPLGVVQFQIQGAAGIVALWTLAWVIWRQRGGA